MKALNKNGVRIRNIRFLGFLKVKIKFLWIRSFDCWRPPKGFACSDYSNTYEGFNKG